MVSGRFILGDLQQGDRLVGRVGFLDGAQGAKAKLALSCGREVAVTAIPSFAAVEEEYDGRLQDFNMILPEECWGEETQINLVLIYSSPYPLVLETALVERPQ
jgi:hypothetical protein